MPGSSGSKKWRLFRVNIIFCWHSWAWHAYVALKTIFAAQELDGQRDVIVLGGRAEIFERDPRFMSHEDPDGEGRGGLFEFITAILSDLCSPQ